MTSTTIAPTRQSSRLHSLDGLRGIAAAIVLLHHTMLTIPVFAEPYYTDEATDPGTLAWWITHTPLHILWEGTAAVYVFFVLSGLVLTLPVVKADAFSWKSYYPHRLLRLYLPVWGSVLLGAVVFLVLPREGEPDSLWLQERPETMDPGGIARSLTLILGPGGLISPLWSLQWEVLFSLALPLYIWIAVRFARWHVALLAACIAAATAGGALSETILIFPPMFMIGSIFAIRLQQIRAAVSGWSDARWALVLVAAALLTSARWTAMAFGLGGWMLGALVGPTLAGSALVIMTALWWKRLEGFLTSRIPMFLGTISFSLYLVHEPIVVGLGYIAGPDLWWSMPAGIIVSIAVGYGFYKAVERPSYAVAKKLKQRQLANSLPRPEARRTAGPLPYPREPVRDAR